MQKFFGSAALLALLTVAGSAFAADCPPGFETRNGQCEIKMACPAGQTMRDGKCQVSSTCPAGQQYMDGLCVVRPAGSSTTNPVFNKK